MNRTADLIQKLHDARRQKNTDGFVKTVGKLISEEPHRWLRLLFDNSLMPEPYINKKPDTFRETHFSFTQFIKNARTNNLFEDSLIANLQGVLDAASQIRSRCQAISKKLSKNPLLQESSATQFFYIGYVLEHDFVQLMQLAPRGTSSQNFIDYAGGLQANISSNIGNPNYSGVGMYEALASGVELAFRYILHTGSSNSVSQKGLQFSDTYFQYAIDLLLLAGGWNSLEHLWLEVRYSGWRPQIEAEGCITYAPDDLKDILTAAVNRTRTNRYISGLSYRLLPLGIERLSYLSLAADLIVLPDHTLVWDGAIDIQCLRNALKRSDFLEMAKITIVNNHYQPFMNKISIQSRSGEANWKAWLTVINAVRDITTVLRIARENANSAGDESRRVPPIVMVKIQDLSSICSQVTGLSVDICQAVITSIVLNHKEKALDIWDQPLLPITPGQVMLLPALIENGHPQSLIEDFVAERVGAATFDLRNATFENHIASIMTRGQGAVTATNVEFMASDGRPVEFDVIVWWDGYLILLEAKCQRSTFSPADEHRVFVAIETSIDQLTHLTQALPFA